MLQDVHMVWLQRNDKDDLDTLPGFAQDSIASWKEHGHSPIIWNEASIIRMLQDRNHHDLLRMYQNVSPWVSRLDIVKYILLYVLGGIYADMDTVCVRSFANILQYEPDSDILVVCEADEIANSQFIQRGFCVKTVINSGVMIAQNPGNKIMRAMLDRIHTSVQCFLDKHGSTCTMTGIDYLTMIGPIALTRCVEDMPELANVLHWHAFESPELIDGPICNQYCIHLHTKTWTSWFLDIGDISTASADYSRFQYANVLVERGALLVCIPCMVAFTTQQHYARKYIYIVAIIVLLGATFSTTRMYPRILVEYSRWKHHEQYLAVLPKKPLYYSPDQFSFLEPLRVNWMAIRDEAVNAMKTIPILQQHSRSYDEWVQADDAIRSRMDAHGWIAAWQEGVQGSNQEWLNYGITFKGEFFPKNIQCCPMLHKCLEPISDKINICGFSWMRPMSRINLHTDTTGLAYGSLAYHLGLIVPSTVRDACKLVVGNVAAVEEEGKVIIFDSSYPHYAENNNVEDRIILYIDFVLDGMKERNGSLY